MLRDWDAFAAGTGAIRKCFISGKGFYYQAIVQNVVVTWSEPHKFNAEIPDEVEISIL